MMQVYGVDYAVLHVYGVDDAVLAKTLPPYPSGCKIFEDDCMFFFLIFEATEQKRSNGGNLGEKVIDRKGLKHEVQTGYWPSGHYRFTIEGSDPSILKADEKECQILRILRDPHHLCIHHGQKTSRTRCTPNPLSITLKATRPSGPIPALGAELDLEVKVQSMVGMKVYDIDINHSIWPLLMTNKH
ncbi:hypothetical protein Cgig2_003594 [Carnegiea gigantea]|uniref:Uncharacterized protein n=1 Tax=Carnegiea gigantea TaxID=171969 RepID=A0A9Q1QDB2_9CARY|nr:hypothetical protein Cgig2_003594 [Carnegiea gigantea]